MNIDPLTIESEQLNAFRRPLLGSVIMKWVKENLNAEDEATKKLAVYLHRNYFKDSLKKKKANSKNYYYIEIARDGSPMLRRDTILSPVLSNNNFSPKINDIRNMIDNIDCFNYSIKNNPHYNKEDKEVYRKIYDLFNFRLSTILSEREKKLYYFSKYGNYKRIQIYNIYHELELDLSTLNCNIF